MGFDDTPLIAVIAVTVFFFVWIQSMAAVMSVSTQLQEAALSFGSSRWQLFRHVVFPASLPQIFVGLRVSAGVGVLVMIGSEFVFAPGAQGVGYRINNARTVFDPLQAYVGLVVSAVLGVVFVSLIKLLAYIALPWSRAGAEVPMSTQVFEIRRVTHRPAGSTLEGRTHEQEHWMKLVATMLALALVAAACGDDDDGADTTEPPATTEAAADGSEEAEADDAASHRRLRGSRGRR